MTDCTFNENDRKILQETHDVIIRLGQWKEDHIKLQDTMERSFGEKFQVIDKRLDIHGGAIRGLQNWRWYVLGFVMAIGIILSFIIEYKR